VAGDINPPSTRPLVILHPRPRVKDLSSVCVTMSPATKTPNFAFHPAAKSIHGEFFTVQHFAVAFPPHLA
jgi:hypothetical protein